MISDPNKPKKLSANEGIKERSNFLRGTISESLSDDSTGSISAEDAQLTKFHGTYMQDDRDIRASLIKEKKEKAFSFMIRVRVPGGVCTPSQWIGIDKLADKFGESTLKLTQILVFKSSLKWCSKYNYERIHYSKHLTLFLPKKTVARKLDDLIFVKR